MVGSKDFDSLFYFQLIGTNSFFLMRGQSPDEPMKVLPPFIEQVHFLSKFSCLRSLDKGSQLSLSYLELPHIL